MRLLGLLRSRLVVQIGAITLVLVAAGFFALGWVNAARQRDAFTEQHRRASDMITQALAAGVRSAMLAGSGLSVRELIEDARRRLPDTKVRIYERHGDEVFVPPGPPPPPESLPAPLRSVLSTGKGADEAGDVRLRPIENEKRCHECHEGPETLRGVLALGTPAARDLTVAETALVEAAFRQLMTSKHEDKLAPMFASLATDCRGLAAEVFDVDGDSRYGRGTGLASDLVLAAIAKRKPETLERAGRNVRLVPLENGARCRGCHKTGEMRGLLAVSVEARLGDTPSRRSELIAETLELGLRNIMLAGLGRLVATFLDEAAVAAEAPTLRLYDAKGRLYHDARGRHAPPARVAEVLASGKAASDADDTAETFTHTSPLLNEKSCTRCHGSDHAVRGAVQIVTSTAGALAAERMAERRAQLSGLGTAAMVALSLWLLFKLLVIDRLRRVGDVARMVGQGKLDVRLEVPPADEIGTLGQRMNEMIDGLQHRFNLERMVSDRAAQAARSAGAQGVSLGGKRERITVWFSDIRGFTAYSEKVEPEKVVAMLNRVLRAQAEVIWKHGGDIDKFVGDEIFAVFHGEGRAARAIRAGLEALDAVAAIDLGGEQIGVGVGINEGDVVSGAVGHETQMDHTVIGDTVNVGARLCSAAERGQVLVSNAVVAAAGELADIAFEQAAPLKLKGKSEPFPVRVARRVT